MSALPTMGYLSRTIRPHLLAEHAQQFDAMVLETAILKLGLPKDLSEESVAILQLSIRLGGFGLRSIVQTSPAAYFSAVAETVPDILGIIPADQVQSTLIEEKSRTTTANAIQSCLDSFQESGLVLGQAPVPHNLTEFWGNFSSPTPGPRLQSAVCSLLESITLEHTKNHLPLHDNQRLIECSRKVCWSLAPSTHLY